MQFTDTLLIGLLSIRCTTLLLIIILSKTLNISSYRQHRKLSFFLLRLFFLLLFFISGRLNMFCNPEDCVFRLPNSLIFCPALRSLQCSVVRGITSDACNGKARQRKSRKEPKKIIFVNLIFV